MLDGTSHYNIENLTSYFWIYTPVRDIEFKKTKDRQLKTLSDLFASKARPGSFENFTPSPVDELHCTIMEQPRSVEQCGQFRWQPLSNERDIDDVINIVSSFVSETAPIKMSGHGLEIVQRRNRGLLMMNMNCEAVSTFQSLYDPMMQALSHIKFYDLYKKSRKPKIVLARSDKGTNKAIKSFQVSTARDFEKIRTKPFVLEQFILGQGFFDIHGYCVAKRRVATIYTNGEVERHCQKPFDVHANNMLVGRRSLQVA